MNRNAVVTPLAAFVLLVCVGWGGAIFADEGSDSSTAEVVLKNVADGVWAALQPYEKRFNDSNSAVIVTERDVIIVDSQADAAWTRGVIAAVRELTDKPVRYLLNTHWHSDHTQGNALWREAVPGLEIIAAETVRDDVPQRARPYLLEQIERWDQAIAAARERFAKGVNREGEPLTDEEKAAYPGELAAAEAKVAAMRAVRWELPSNGLDGEWVFERETGPIRLMTHRAHTRGDLTVWLPLQKVLITGDLLDDIPYGGHGFPGSWVDTLGRLATAEFDVVIPGHGDLLDREHLFLIYEFLIAIREQAARAAEEQLSLEAFRAAVDLAEFRERFVREDAVAARNYDGFLPDLLERAWLEARGEPLE